AWSPDGRMLAALLDSYEIAIWSLELRRTLHRLTGHAKYIFDLSWSSDSRRLASISVDATLVIWDAVAGTQVVTFATTTTDAFRQVAWRPGTCNVATQLSDSGTVVFIDANDGSYVAGFPQMGTGHWRRLLWSPDGISLAATDYLNGIVVWTLGE